MRYLFALLLAWSSFGVAESFTVADVRLEGLQRVSAGTVFASFPITGETVDDGVWSMPRAPCFAQACSMTSNCCAMAMC